MSHLIRNYYTKVHIWHNTLCKPKRRVFMSLCHNESISCLNLEPLVLVNLWINQYFLGARPTLAWMTGTLVSILPLRKSRKEKTISLLSVWWNMFRITVLQSLFYWCVKLNKMSEICLYIANFHPHFILFVTVPFLEYKIGILSIGPDWTNKGRKILGYTVLCNGLHPTIPQ